MGGDGGGRAGGAVSVRRVLVHGFLGAPTMWTRVVAGLRGAAETRAVLPGHGADPWTPDGDFASVCAAFSARLGLRAGDVLVGYSMGARVALAMALGAPGVRAVLIGCDFGIRDAGARAERARWEDAQAAAIEREGMEAFVRGWEALPVFETQRALPEAARRARREERLGHTARGAAWAMRTLGTGRMPSYGDALAALAGRCLLVTGARDEKFTALAAQRGLPHVRIEGVGHDVALEAPEALAAVLAGFERDEANG